MLRFKKVLLIISINLIVGFTIVYGDTSIKNSSITYKVQRDPHIVKLSNNKYCYREDISSLSSCVLISTEDALKAINGYRD